MIAVYAPAAGSPLPSTSAASLAIWRQKYNDRRSLQDAHRRMMADFWKSLPDDRGPIQKPLAVSGGEIEIRRRELTRTAADAFLADTSDRIIAAWAVVPLLQSNRFREAVLAAKKLEDAASWDRFEGGAVPQELSQFATEARQVAEAHLEGGAEIRVSSSEIEWLEELELRAREEIEFGLKPSASVEPLPRVEIQIGNGRIEVELFEDDAPNTVANFISLVEKRVYDGLTFHRVVPRFVCQGGDPTGTSAGGPGYRIPFESSEGRLRRNFRGTVSMARSLERNSGGSQFYFNLARNTHLDGEYVVFGRVIQGEELIDQIQRGDHMVVRVLRKRSHDYVPRTLPW